MHNSLTKIEIEGLHGFASEQKRLSNKNERERSRQDSRLLFLP